MRTPAAGLGHTSSLHNTPAWHALSKHADSVSALHMRDLFANDSERFSRYSINSGALLLDYSKNRITDGTMDQLIALAKQVGLEKKRDAMFAGERINNTEQRAVLHTALRNPGSSKVMFDGKDVVPDVLNELNKMRGFVERVRSKDWTGCSGKAISDVVNIGIGGSDLGPKMVCQALKPYASDNLRIHFVSNVDAVDIEDTLSQLDPETTLFIIASKTFTTQETMTNAGTARKWFLDQKGIAETDIARHFVAVSTNAEAVSGFGIDTANMFRFWDWVGGRYSLWSAVGLPIMLAIGMDGFEELLAGAHSMDRHFAEQPLAENMPVIMALLGVWYHNFLGAESIAVLPYDHNLSLLPDYLQQADMESNGKSVSRDGLPLGHSSGPVLWGASGINGQHAFYQLIHQGTRVIPADFILAAKSQSDNQQHSRILASNFLAQTEALMRGRSVEETKAQLEQAGLDTQQIQERLPHMVFAGNQPTNSIVLSELSPHNLGALIALYEHKIFVQGVIWDVNSFDQWGVELGKKLALNVLSELESGEDKHEHDSSTQGLLNHLRSHSA